MKKRHFLRTAASALAATAATATMSAPALAARKSAAGAGPVLLTVTGEIAAPNRGPLDHALDQMMHKQKLEFDKARTFDFAALTALPALDIRPTLEYDGKRHTLRGPLLEDVMRAAGADPAAQGYVLRAIDGYAVMVSREDAQKYRFIVATHLDGKPMALGGLGPLWAVYEADRFPEMASRPVSERFGLCPWGIYHIAVRKG
ncbi:molybdopterin-dependent oxidoreductase [Herbaspirillum sp. LeCh32-8]|uniref:molybdopterin-dependent oxidoreductase n=1 Tax=Herbaspirillum sp. LeCh32-8 TaxID=2821356 RepID=UPI001AE82DA2|nr:molybdopterin-dependent oxidoreductase [Herbaspirillum sp. LeCh32-8]MBP0598268.1 molybdopterin-dependent oxidoreductase [Herbaspirillum sp. LeCh32-8]